MAENNRDRIDLLRAERDGKELTDEELVRLATIRSQPKGLVDIVAREISTMIAQKAVLEERIKQCVNWLNGYDLEYREDDNDLSDFDRMALSVADKVELEDLKWN